MKREPPAGTASPSHPSERRRGKRILLHVGMLKTGTTSLQSFLQNSRDDLAARGIGYYLPRFDPHPSFSNAGFLCRRSLSEARGLPPEPSSNLEMAAFSAYAGAFDTLLLSEEFLSELGAEVPGYWEIVRKNLAELAGEHTQIDVLLFVRRQDDWILSRWKQQVLNAFYEDRPTPPDIPDFTTFAGQAKARGLLDYDRAADRLAKVFGREHVTVCAYGAADGSSFDAVGAFLGAAGISADVPAKPLKENRSLSARAVNALLRINGSAPTSIPRSRLHRAARTFSRLYPEEQAVYPVSRDERIRFLSEFEESNQRLSLAYNNGIPLFSRVVPACFAWPDDPKQTCDDAALLLKLATLSRETAAALLRAARSTSREP